MYLTSESIPPPHPMSSILKPFRGFDGVMFCAWRCSRALFINDTLSLFIEWRAINSPSSFHHSLVGLLSFSISSSSTVTWQSKKKMGTTLGNAWHVNHEYIQLSQALRDLSSAAFPCHPAFANVVIYAIYTKSKLLSHNLMYIHKLQVA